MQKIHSDNPKNGNSAKLLLSDGFSTKRVGLISFSGGETSAFMLQWLLKNKSNEYDFKVVFANTGRENNQTLEFVKQCSEEFNVEIVWIESNVWGNVKDKTKHVVVNYETATKNQDWKKRDNTPYEEMVKKYGLPNISNRFSTRELKDRPIQSYMRSIGFKDLDYDIFIGIRYDELDRMIDETKNPRNFVYPLIKWMKWTKKHVNFWWSQMPFRLLLKGWEGNCVTCYKKTLEKLMQIMIDDAWKFEFDEYLEWKYEYYIPESRIKKLVSNLKRIPTGPFRLFRNNNSVNDIRQKAKKLKKKIKDDTVDVSFQIKLFEESESCEVFSRCGS